MIFLSKLYRWQYPFIMLSSFIIAYLTGNDNERLMSLLLLLWVFYGFLAFNKSPNNSFKVLLSVLIAYCILSGVNYISNGIPFVAYYSDFRSAIIPMLCAYIGMVNSDDKLYKFFVYSTVFCCVVGIYLFLVQPSWYLGFMVNALSEGIMGETNLNENNVMFLSASGRMSSFFPSTYNVVFYSIFSLCILFSDLYKGPENRIVKSNFQLISIIIILVISVFLAMTRVAIAFIILLFLFYSFYGITTRNHNRRLLRRIIVVLFLIVAVSIGYLLATDYGSFIIDVISSRLSLESIEEVSEGSSRMNQTHEVLASWKNIILGDGMGSKGGFARLAGLPGITDNNWIKYLVEYGLVGLGLYIIVFVKSIAKGYSNRRYFMAELTIVIYGLISMLVAGSLIKGDITIMFWFAMGRLWNKELIVNRRLNNDHI